MGLQDIKTEIQYGCTFAMTREEMKFFLKNPRIVEYKKEHAASGLGMEIMKHKKWLRIEGNPTIYEVRLYVFTPAELMDFMEAKFKSRLQKMATDEWLSEEQREALMIQSERF